MIICLYHSSYELKIKGNNKETQIIQHEEQENYSSRECHFSKIKDWH